MNFKILLVTFFHAHSKNFDILFFFVKHIYILFVIFQYIISITVLWQTWLTKATLTTIIRLILQHLTNCLAYLYSQLSIRQLDQRDSYSVSKHCEECRNGQTHYQIQAALLR